MVGFWDPSVPNVGAPGYEGASQRLADILERTYKFYESYYGFDKDETADLLRDIQDMKPWHEGGTRIGPEGTGITTIHEYFIDDPWRMLDAFKLGRITKLIGRALKYGAGATYGLVREYPEETYRVLHTLAADIAEKQALRWGLKQLDVVVGKVPTGEYPEFTYKFWTRKEAASGVQRRGLFYTRRGAVPQTIDPIRTTSAQVIENLRRGIRFDTMDDIRNFGYEVVKSIGKRGMEQVEEATENKAREAIEMAWFQRRRRGYGYNRGYVPRRRYRRYGSSSRYNYGRRPQYGVRRGYFRPRRWY